MLYVGVDAHRASLHITIMGERGKVVKRAEVASSRRGIKRALGGYLEPMKAVVEAGYSWGTMYDWLSEVAEEVLLAHPSKVRVKTDKIDSETLAHLLRADLIPQAYAPSIGVRARKRVLRQRMFLVRVRTMVKNRIKAREWLGRLKLAELAWTIWAEKRFYEEHRKSPTVNRS